LVSSPGVAGTVSGALFVAAHPGDDALSSFLENLRPHAGYLGRQRYFAARRTGKCKTREVSRNAREGGSRYWDEPKTQVGLPR